LGTASPEIDGETLAASLAASFICPAFDHRPARSTWPGFHRRVQHRWR